VAEGIAGGVIPADDIQSGKDRSYLMSLCEAGHQAVTVTGAYKKSVNLMFEHANSMIRYLDDVVTAAAKCDNTIKWSNRFLVEKAEARVALNPHQEHP
jgi:hypothetical protein